MIFKFKFGRVYGRVKFYPLSEEAKILVTSVDLNKKCLNADEFLRVIKLSKYGAEFEVYENMERMSFFKLKRILNADKAQ